MCVTRMSLSPRKMDDNDIITTNQRPSKFFVKGNTKEVGIWGKIRAKKTDYFLFRGQREGKR